VILGVKGCVLSVEFGYPLRVRDLHLFGSACSSEDSKEGLLDCRLDRRLRPNALSVRYSDK
jgi:hypothetical protein